MDLDSPHFLLMPTLHPANGQASIMNHRSDLFSCSFEVDELEATDIISG
jgi:hypothetical protein